ncbi:MAG: ketopantoate reductase family protein [Candidatus Aminicenantes bacterium]|nr:ketopantoate reductase family protein [Candidatus Aminicenantes bacterium]
MIQEENSKKKVLVIGLGAIGQMFACRLKASGCSVYGVDVAQDCIKAIAKNGISIEGIASLKCKLDGVATKTGDLKEREFDYVVICVKTPYMEKVVESLKSIEDGFQIVSMQNGIDNEEFLAKHFDRERVMRFVVNFAGNLIGPGRVKMIFFHKPNYVGCLCGTENCEHAAGFARMINAARLDTEPTNDIKKLAFRKTVLVAALAPIAALLGMTMVEVMTEAETRYLVEMLLEEAIEVARGRGYDYGDDFFKYCLNYLTSAGHHKPSMLIDIESGSPTEIEYINGKISFLGHELDIPVHLNTYLTLLVKAKEKLQAKRLKGE